MDALSQGCAKNPTEEVRVSLTSYRGHDLVDIRVFFQDEQGEWRPTQTGVSLSVDSSPSCARLSSKPKRCLTRCIGRQQKLRQIARQEGCRIAYLGAYPGVPRRSQCPTFPLTPLGASC